MYILRDKETVTLLLDWSQLTGLVCDCCVKMCVLLSQSSQFPPVICQVNRTLAGIAQERINQPCTQISMLVQQVRLVKELMGLVGVQMCAKFKFRISVLVMVFF